LRRSGTGDTVDLGGKAQLSVDPGDVLTIETPGGGACAAPAARSAGAT
jgi:N-methylhydantoinase B/oxoprolinase/acetone carboxylase alpha subunit